MMAIPEVATFLPDLGPNKYPNRDFFFKVITHYFQLN